MLAWRHGEGLVHRRVSLLSRKVDDRSGSPRRHRPRGAAAEARGQGPRQRVRHPALQVERARGAVPAGGGGRESEGEGARPQVPGRAEASEGLARPAASPVRLGLSGDLLGDVLRRTSRTFYLSLAILPRPLREPIGLAYFLARVTDSVADTRLLPRAYRREHLETLRAAYRGAATDVKAIGRECAPLQAHAAEREIVGRVDEALARVERLPPHDRDAVRGVLTTITEGQLFDLEHFIGDSDATLSALETLDELDRYTYLVAGSVGDFWTAMHLAHRPRLARWDRAAMKIGRASCRER